MTAGLILKSAHFCSARVFTAYLNGLALQESTAHGTELLFLPSVSQWHPIVFTILAAVL